MKSPFRFSYGNWSGESGVSYTEFAVFTFIFVLALAWVYTALPTAIQADYDQNTKDAFDFTKKGALITTP